MILISKYLICNSDTKNNLKDLNIGDINLETIKSYK